MTTTDGVPPQQSSPEGTEEDGLTSDENVSPSDARGFRAPIRIGVAIVIIALMWALLIIPGKLAPLTLAHFASMQGGPILALLALATWWLMAFRLSRRERLLGLLLTIGFLVATIMTVHSSMRILMLVKALPIALTILVVLWTMFSNQRWSVRRWIGWGGFAAFLLVSQCVRVGQIDGNFNFNLVSRWKPTAEDRFLASLETENADRDTSDLSIESFELPRQVSPRDSAEFRGPRRDGVVRDFSFATDWDTNPPKEKWRHPVGPGWSSFCVVAPWFFTQEQRGPNEVVVAYEIESGFPVWTHQREGRFEASMGGIGPRATPTYDRGDLFVMHANGIVERLDAATGRSVWEFDLIDNLNVRMPAWGFASSPLVVDLNLGDSSGAGLVIVFAGGGEGQGVVALDRETGTLAWSAGDGSHGYSSPHRAEIDGVDQVLMASNVGMLSLSPETGNEIWRHDWNIGDMARVTQPLVVDHSVFLGTGYGNGTMRIDVAKTDSGWSTDEKWISKLKPYYNDFVHRDGFIYGFDGPIFMCLDAETGDKAWKRGRYGYGQVLLIEDMNLLLITTEKGEVVLAEANPERLVEIAKIPAVTGTTWNLPVIAQDLLLVRNAEEMVAFELNRSGDNAKPTESTEPTENPEPRVSDSTPQNRDATET